MPGKSPWAERAVLNAFYRSAAFPKPSNVYIGLVTAFTEGENAPTEPVGNGYARVALAVADASWALTTDAEGRSSLTNATEIVFPAVTGAGWGLVVAAISMTAVSGGTLIHEAILTPSRQVLAGDPVRLPVGLLRISEG